MGYAGRMMRWMAVPAVMAAIAFGATVGSPVSAQDMAPTDMMSNQQPMSSPMMSGDTMMNSTTVMVPANASGTEMMSVTVRMPMEMMGSMMMSDQQPTVRQIPGVGYEIDYGGPSIMIQRVGQN